MDERTVSSYGIRKDGDTAFLYLLSAKMAELTEQRYEEDQAQVMLSSTSSLTDAAGERRKYNTLPNMSPKKGLTLLCSPCGHQWGGKPGSCLAPAQGARPGVAAGMGTLASGCCCARVGEDVWDAGGALWAVPPWAGGQGGCLGCRTARKG